MVSRAAAAHRWWTATGGVCRAGGRLRLALAASFPSFVGKTISVNLLPSGPPIFLRTDSSDRGVFWQVFVCRQYDLDYGLASPSVIVDAGANIGLTAVYFSRRHPDARIVALEPDAENYAMLMRNVRASANIVPLKAALWHKRTTLEIRDPGIGAWALRVDAPPDQVGRRGSGRESAYRGLVEATTVREVMDANGGRIDLLKLDIEGSEWSVLSHAGDWIAQVGTVVVEIHPEIHPDCREVFDAATAGFRYRETHGELLLARR